VLATYALSDGGRGAQRYLEHSSKGIEGGSAENRG
jgi:hypothetical protein